MRRVTCLAYAHRMDTNPLLARRVIPLGERLQKAFAMLLVTAAVVGGAVYFGGLTLDSDPRLLAGLLLASITGVAATLYLAFKKNETGRSKEESQAIRRRIRDDRGGTHWVTRLPRGLWRFSWGAVLVLGILVSLAGLGVLAWQAVGYLQTGSWPRMSVFAVLAPHLPWLTHPESWLGLHALVTKGARLLPIWVLLLVCGWFIGGVGAALRGKA